jgi:hypothetical protein
VIGKRGDEAVVIETQMLTRKDSTDLIIKTLKKVPVFERLNMIVHCQYNSKEVGSLRKRVIIDERH